MIAAVQAATKPVCDHVYQTLDDGTEICFECDHIKGDDE